MGDENPLVLVVEDASDVRQLVRRVLERAGFGVAEAADGNAALRQFHQVRPDVVVLDVGLPGLDGWQVLERIRIMSETPLLMLTALGTEFDKIRGLDGGADDYLVKPFSNGELVARVRALSRRPVNPTISRLHSTTVHCTSTTRGIAWSRTASP
jgi:DNA-binding response OmpR family regulator